MIIPMMLILVSHTQPTGATQSSVLAALSSLSVLNGLHRIRLRVLRSQALPGRRLRHLATIQREKSGPVNRSRIRQILMLASLSISPSCMDGPAEDTRDQYREIVDISRDPDALREYLKPIPPTEPAEALKTFETTGGFRMELVAHEPQVVEPLSATFDENGRMYVAEFYGYPRQPPPGEEGTGRIRLLEDRDGDGHYEAASVFADKLVWPTGVAVWKQGLFVSAPPDILYFKDTDGDGQADIREKIYTGFGVTNEQQMLNNIIWGVDHKIYASTGGNGGYIRPGDQPDAKPISVYNRDFSFDPVTRQLELTTQTFQFGHTFDAWYNRFVCRAGSFGRHVVMPPGYLERNPYLFFDLHGYLTMGNMEVNALTEGRLAIYRTSPIERWRKIRQARRIFAGRIARVEEGGREDYQAYAAAWAGVKVYTGHAYPEKYRGNIFTGAATANLLHRRVLEPDGATFRAVRDDAENTEFVRSSDNWFRPVNSVNAPDGTLYVLDMCRELIEHGHVPERVLEHLDFSRGSEHGRIYRVAPPGFKVPPAPRLGEASIQELVGHLEHPGGWWRETAHRLIYERQDPSAVSGLRRLLKESKHPLARMHALWSLKGLGALRDADVARALSDSSPGVRMHAVEHSESRMNRSRGLSQRILEMAGDENPRVRLRVALALGEIGNSRILPALVKIARSDSTDRWIRNSVLSSSTDLADRLFTELAKLDGFDQEPLAQQWLAPLARVVGGRGIASELNRLTGAVSTYPTLASQPQVQLAIVTSLAEGLAINGRTFTGLENIPASATRMIQSLLDGSRSAATDAELAEEERLPAIRLLRHAAFEEVREALTALVDAKQPQALQLAAIEALAGYNEPAIAPLLLESWATYTPKVRGGVLSGILSRLDWTRALLGAIESEEIPARQIDAKRRELLMNHDDEGIQERAVSLFESVTPGERQDVLADYRAALTLAGDRGRGEEVYRRECIKCHRLGTTQHPVGPNLIVAGYEDPEPLLASILDPNRLVESQYTQYVVTDQKGRLYTGLMAQETAASITLAESEDLQNTLLRRDIREIRATGQSLMPEGLEETISHQEMADLMTFILDYQYVVGAEGGGYGPGQEVFGEPLETRRYTDGP